MAAHNGRIFVTNTGRAFVVDTHFSGEDSAQGTGVGFGSEIRTDTYRTLPRGVPVVLSDLYPLRVINEAAEDVAVAQAVTPKSVREERARLASILEQNEPVDTPQAERREDEGTTLREVFADTVPAPINAFGEEFVSDQIQRDRGRLFGTGGLGLRPLLPEEKEDQEETEEEQQQVNAAIVQRSRVNIAAFFRGLRGN